MQIICARRMAGLKSLFCARHCALSALTNNSRKVDGALSVEQISIQK